MAKYNRIRWRDSDQKELRRVVKNFNAKIDYQRKINPDMSDILPSKVTVKDIKANIMTRRDLNFELSRLRAFSKRNATDIKDVKGGTRTIKWEYDQAKRMLRRINARKKQERKKANVSTEKGTMGSIAKNNLNDKQFRGDSGPQSWEKFVDSLLKQHSDLYWARADENYKNNYLHALQQIMGSSDSEYFKAIEEIVKNIPSQYLLKAQYDNPILSIDFIYADTDDIDLEEEIGDPIINAWLSFANKEGYSNKAIKYWNNHVDDLGQ